MMKWRIDYNFIADSGEVETYSFNKEYFNLDEAINAYLDYTKTETDGWYNLIEITEKIVKV